MPSLHQITRRQLALLAAAACCSRWTSPARARQSQTLSLALDWYPNANHAGIYLADERGWFAEAGISLDPYTPSDPTTVLQTVGAGRDDLGISYQTDVLLARDQGVPVVSMAALVQHPLVVVMSLAESGILAPGDLTGKAIGYPGIPSQVAFLETMLAAGNASIDDVSLVNIGFNLVPALISEQVDAVMGAYWTHETILAEQEGYPVNVLHVEDWGVPDYYELVLVASEESLENRSDLLATALGILQRGYQAVIDDPEAGLAALASAYPELDEIVEQQGIALLSDVWLDSPPVFGHQSPERWETYGEWMKEQGLISEDLDLAAAFTTSLVSDHPATPVSG